MQFAVRGLAPKMSEPTHSAWKHLVHLVQYMSRTEGYHLVYRKTPRGLSNLHDSIRNGSYDFTGITPKEHHSLRGIQRLRLGRKEGHWTVHIFRNCLPRWTVYLLVFKEPEVC